MQPDDFTATAPGRATRQPAGYWAFIPNPLLPTIPWSAELVEILSAADCALGELAGWGHTLPNPRLLTQPFIRREATLSSRIEWTRTSLTDLYAYDTVQLSLLMAT